MTITIRFALLALGLVWAGITHAAIGHAPAVVLDTLLGIALAVRAHLRAIGGQAGAAA